jgi:hypothetical protein
MVLVQLVLEPLLVQVQMKCSHHPQPLYPGVTDKMQFLSKNTC